MQWFIYGVLCYVVKTNLTWHTFYSLIKCIKLKFQLFYVIKNKNNNDDGDNKIKYYTFTIYRIRFISDVQRLPFGVW